MCLFQDGYMTEGYHGGQDVADILVKWLTLLFPKAEYFAIHLVGDFGHLYYRMNEAWVGVEPFTLIEFIKRFEKNMEEEVEFTVGQTNVDTRFHELAHQYSSDPTYERVLRESTNEIINEFLVDKNEKPEGKVVLVEAVECFDRVEYDDFLKASNKEVFKDRYFCGGL